MARVTMYSTAWCPFCRRAEALRQRKGVLDLVKIEIDHDPPARETMMIRSGRRSVPQIVIDETHVGGFDDLAALDRAGRLNALLAA